MKRNMLFAAMSGALVLSSPLVALAGEDVVYGTMQIPFAQFYENEGVEYEVDAVSSATDSKWFSDSLATGGYSQKHESDDGGDILGVIYPVAISGADLEALGEDNYGFEELSQEPKAYKEVTVSDGEVSFLAVTGQTQELDAGAVLTTRTVWGDYEIDIDAINNADGTSDIGPIDGAMLKTSDGTVYAMRQLENIWRDELSWSSGITVEEPHGNIMSSANFVSLMGSTISEIIYITDDGYHVISTNLYVPVKFEGGCEVESVEASDGQSAITFTGLPEDYEPEYAVRGLDISVEDGILSWEDAYAGAYTLTVSDASGKYADIDASFVLSTDELPVAYDAESLSIVPAEGYDEEQAEAFLANLATVTVGDTEYAASGRGAVAIVDVDGEVDTEAAIVKGRGADAESTPVFAEAGDYDITVAATGYSQVLEFTLTVE